MRFLELRADEGIEPLRLHSRLTLVRGLDPAARVALVGFLHSVATTESHVEQKGGDRRRHRVAHA